MSSTKDDECPDMFKEGIRRLLLECGYLVKRLDFEPPPSMADYLRTLGRRTTRPLAVVCFDHEVRVQYEILRATPSANVAFLSPDVFHGGARNSDADGWQIVPKRPFVVILDIGVCSFDTLLARLPWLTQATTILLRQELASFRSEHSDLVTLSATMKTHGYDLEDVIDHSHAPALASPSNRLTLVFEGQINERSKSQSQHYRANEALIHLSSPIVGRESFQLLAGRGSFGYGSGVLNPGAMLEGGRILLLCRTEHTPWALIREKEQLFFDPSPPVLVELGDDGALVDAQELTVTGRASHASSRLEDFRVFRYDGELFSNHVVISKPAGKNGHNGKLHLEAMETRIGISHLDLAQKRLDWRGYLSIDRPLAKIEKNWVMFADGEQLYLLYSFDPYILLSCDDWKELRFHTVHEAMATSALSRDGLPLRNSINPVNYDGNHWLHIVHKVHPDKRYAFWAVLIDKKTLLPAMISNRPLVRSNASAPASTVYACSAICEGDDLFVFGGIDDCASGAWKVNRSLLDRHWIPISSNDSY